MKPDSLMRFVVAACYGLEYLGQLFTILFCFIRVLVCSGIFIVWSILSVLISLVGCSPHAMYSAMGMQLSSPFQYGAMVLTSTFAYGSPLHFFGHSIFSFIVTICIIVMTLMMVLKMKSLKLINHNSKRKAKAEKTLAITVCIILIPSVLSQVMTITCLWEAKYACYITLIRPILLDCRVNIVSCYFYWTHPYFKNNSKTIQSVNVKSLSST